MTHVEWQSTPPTYPARTVFRTVLTVGWVLAASAVAWADDAAPQRPTIKTNRWQEDWSVLVNPALRTEPYDAIKYIPILPGDPKSYMSFGATLRERFESVNAAGFGVGGTKSDNYVIQRLQFHADVHFDEHWQLFLQFEDDRAFGKNVTTPVDQDPLDLRLGFLAYVNATEVGTFKARVGRQDFDFDLQRFVSSRDGPNVRQSFDAVWGDWESGPWRFIGFLSQPVQYDLISPFDDTSNSHFRFHTLRVERQVLGTNELSAYYSFYQKDNVHFLFATGMKNATSSMSASPEISIMSIGISRRWGKPERSAERISAPGRSEREPDTRSLNSRGSRVLGCKWMPLRETIIPPIMF